MTDYLLPDAEALLISYLNSDPAVTALVHGRIAKRLPPRPQFPSIRLNRFGGIPERRWADHAAVQIEAYARGDDEAFRLMMTVLDALKNIPQVHDEGVVTGMDPRAMRPFSDPSLLNKNGNPMPRWILDIELTTHPHRTPVAG